MTRKTDLLDAIECCRQEGTRCDRCPLQGEICDTLRVEMISLPEDLVEKIEEELAKN